MQIKKATYFDSNKSLGLKRGTVQLKPYSKDYAVYFEKEKQLILHQLNDPSIKIEHIGSTAIPDLISKPIIDMVLGLESIDLKDIQGLIPKLEQLGYHYMHDFGDRHFLAKGPESNRTHHLNLVIFQDPVQWQEKIQFRELLITNPDLRQAYQEKKQELQSQSANNRQQYTKLKSKFIQELISKYLQK